MTISTTLTTDGSTDPITIRSTQNNGLHLHLSGGFGGGTANLKFLAGDGNYKTLANGSFTEAADKQVVVPNGTVVQLELTGSTTPTLYVQINTMQGA